MANPREICNYQQFDHQLGTYATTIQRRRPWSPRYHGRPDTVCTPRLVTGGKQSRNASSGLLDRMMATVSYLRTWSITCYVSSTTRDYPAFSQIFPLRSALRSVLSSFIRPYLGICCEHFYLESSSMKPRMSVLWAVVTELSTCYHSTSTSRITMDRYIPIE